MSDAKQDALRDAKAAAVASSAPTPSGARIDTATPLGERITVDEAKAIASAVRFARLTGAAAGAVLAIGVCWFFWKRKG